MPFCAAFSVRFVLVSVGRNWGRRQPTLLLLLLLLFLLLLVTTTTTAMAIHSMKMDSQNIPWSCPICDLHFSHSAFQKLECEHKKAHWRTCRVDVPWQTHHKQVTKRAQLHGAETIQPTSHWMAWDTVYRRRNIIRRDIHSARCFVRFQIGMQAAIGKRRVEP